MEDQEKGGVFTFFCSEGRQCTAYSSRIPCIPSLRKIRCAQPFRKFPPSGGENTCSGVINGLTFRGRLGLEEVMLHAFFPPLSYPDHTEQFLPVGNSASLLCQIVAPIIVIGERLDEKHGSFVSVSVSLQPTWLGVRKATAL